MGGEHLSSSTVSSSLVTTPWEVRPKLLVLPYKSDTGNKRRNTLNISGRCLPDLGASDGGGGVALMGFDARVHTLSF